MLPLPSPTYEIASVGRALRLLSAFADQPRITVTEAAQLLDVAPSTAHRMLQMLVHHSFAVQAEDRTYHRGPAADALGSASNRLERFRSAARPDLNEIRDELPGATVHLIVLEGNCGRFIAGAEAHGNPGVARARVGWLLPAHTLAGGKALLAELPAETVDALYPDGLPMTRPSRIRETTQLQAVLRDVRERGFALSNDAHHDICAIGVPVPSEGAGPQVALSVGWRKQSFPVRSAPRIVRLLRDRAQELGQAGA